LVYFPFLVGLFAVFVGVVIVVVAAVVKGNLFVKKYVLCLPMFFML
jgi:hypothetical protein